MSIAERVRREYDGAAGEYDRRWTRYTRDSLALLRPWIDGRALGRVLDVGCGTGNLLPRLTDWGASVDAYVGVDLSAGMLGRAREKMADAAFPSAPVAGSALAVPMRGATYDTAVSASNLHDWPNAAAGLRDVRRVLRPGGVLLLVDWDRAPLRMRAFDGVMRGVLGVGYQRMYSRREMRTLLEDAGFAVDAESRGGAGPLWRFAAFRARPR